MNGRTNTNVNIINGILIPLEQVTSFIGVGQNQKVCLSWIDPVDKVASPGGELVAEWSHTIIVRKEGSYPNSPLDGDVVVKSTIRDQYSSTPYIDYPLSNENTYYYSAYAFSTLNVISEPSMLFATPILEVFAYDAELTPLSIARNGFTAASIEGYAFFMGGGSDNNNGLRTVDVYDDELTHSLAAELSDDRVYHGGTSISDKYAVVGGGGSSWHKSTVEAYDSSLTKVSNVPVMSQGRKRFVASNVGKYALFGGGEYNTSSYNTEDLSSVEAYDDALTRTSAANLYSPMSTYYGFTSSQNVKHHAMFLLKTRVDAYDEYLTKTSPTSISGAEYGVVGIGSTAIHAIVANDSSTAQSTSSRSTYIMAYDENMTKSMLETLEGSYLRTVFIGGSLGGIALINASRVCYVWDSLLTRRPDITLKSSVANGAYASVGNNGIFAENQSYENTESSAVGVYI